MALNIEKKSALNGVTASLWLGLETVINEVTKKATRKYGLYASQADFDAGYEPLDTKWMKYEGASYAALGVSSLLTKLDAQAKVNKDEFFKGATG